MTKPEDGLLSIDLVREVPEQLKPRRIEIDMAPAAAAVSQDNQKSLGACEGESKAA